jgi:diguanylate cyclase (GGDEF)-like protein
VLLQRTRAPDAVRVANRVRHALAAGTVNTGAREMRLTASAGVSGFPSDGIDGPSVLEAADFALRRAKSLGKDRVERAWSSGSATTLVDLTGTDWAGTSAAVPRARA